MHWIQHYFLELCACSTAKTFDSAAIRCRSLTAFASDLLWCSSPRYMATRMATLNLPRIRTQRGMLRTAIRKWGTFIRRARLLGHSYMLPYFQVFMYVLLNHDCENGGRGERDRQRCNIVASLRCSPSYSWFLLLLHSLGSGTLIIPDTSSVRQKREACLHYNLRLMAV